MMCLATDVHAPPRGQQIDDAKARVVPAAHIPAPGIPEADHDPHALSFATLLPRGRRLCGGRSRGGLRRGAFHGRRFGRLGRLLFDGRR